MEKGRKINILKILLSIIHYFFSPHYRAFANIIILPAVLYGCSSADTDAAAEIPETEDYVETSVSISSAMQETDGVTDIFTFKNDRLRKLDSYQRVTGTEAKIASTRGERIVVAVQNPHCGTQRWAGINSYEGFLEKTALLSEDSPDHPVMTGEIVVQAGEDGVSRLKVDRILSSVCINSLKVDFSGTEYAGEGLSDVKIYLTNVNAECRMMQTEGFLPGMVVNFAGFDEIASNRFSHTEMLFREIGNITPSRPAGPVCMYCYPCDHSDETAGSPFTRVVVEGRIRGHIYYYPITINRRPFGDGGIRRGCSYSYDIVIRRSGTPGPDIPADTGMVSVTCSIVPWHEVENTVIKF